MAFDPSGLTKLRDLNGPALHQTTIDAALWVYDSGADNLAATVTAGYFNAARDTLSGPVATASLILAICSDGFRMLRLTAPAAPSVANITVTALLGAVS